jgi:hypothetical protein
MYLQHFISLGSQLLVAAKIASNSGGLTFALACLAEPLFRQLVKVSIWKRGLLPHPIVFLAFINPTPL